MKRRDAKNKPKEQQDLPPIQEIRVQLKPIAGVPPERYVPVAWATIVAVILFLVLVLPGIRNNGAETRLVSVPAGGSVYVDGVRVGATPVTAFVAKGTHTFRLVHPAFQEVTVEEQIPGRIVGSWLFPRRVTVSLRPKSADIGPAHAAQVADFSQWALGAEPGPQFQLPWLASEEALWRAAAGESSASADSFLMNYLLHASHEVQVADLIRAQMVTDAGAGLPGPASLISSVHSFIQLVNESQRADRLLLRTIGEGVPGPVGRFTESRAEEVNTRTLKVSLYLDEQAVPTSRVREVAGLEFGRIPEGEYVLGYPAREAVNVSVPVEFGEFWLQTNEVSQSEFQRFLSETPLWRAENRSELVDRGLADDSYLSDFEPFAGANEPVRNVSWYAAHAYAEWFQGRLDARGLQFDVRLPRSTEWEYAAFLNQIGGPSVVTYAGGPARVREGTAGSLGLYHMTGNVWEWSDDWYATNRFLRPAEPVAYGSMRAVTGGSYINDTVAHDSVGALPPEWCTPFQGFRILLIERGS